jgi:hypothetical protein
VEVNGATNLSRFAVWNPTAAQERIGLSELAMPALDRPRQAVGTARTVPGLSSRWAPARPPNASTRMCPGPAIEPRPRLGRGPTAAWPCPACKQRDGRALHGERLSQRQMHEEKEAGKEKERVEKAPSVLRQCWQRQAATARHRPPPMRVHTYMVVYGAPCSAIVSTS